MRVDAQFNEWWTQPLGKSPIPEGHTTPMLKNLQVHPEEPHLCGVKKHHLDRAKKKTGIQTNKNTGTMPALQT
jgi:hypothetical protein